ncbi:coiled-coil domain-containing protein 89-like [Macrobrachium rosenbergii]|uniref:coiled-coil domain-containing protein 89-like n=1 Tax=Macrobrachium rosenbergii TaxID=79674 RepID=UPI0034D5F8AA
MYQEREPPQRFSFVQADGELYRGQLEIAEQQLAALKTEMFENIIEKHRLLSENEGLKLENERLRKDNSYLHGRLFTNEQELKRTNAKLEDYESTCLLKEQRIRELTRSLKNLQEELLHARRRGDFGNLDESARRLQDDVNKLKRINEDLPAQIHRSLERDKLSEELRDKILQLEELRVLYERQALELNESRRTIQDLMRHGRPIWK